MSESRKDVLSKALEAEVGGAPADLATLFTDDVVGWSPYAVVSGLEALAGLAALREDAFSNVVIMFRAVDEVGNKAFAEWLIEADHTGPSSSATMRWWRQQGGMFSCRVSRSPISARERSGPIGPTSTISR